MAQLFPFEVCNVCLDKYGKSKHKIESLLDSRCLQQPIPHKSVTVRVRLTDGILEPRVRPMPKVFFRGHFVFCDPDRCIGERCTFPHCSKEKEEWNAQKYSVYVSSSPVGAPTSTPSSLQPDQSGTYKYVTKIVGGLNCEIFASGEVCSTFGHRHPH